MPDEPMIVAARLGMDVELVRRLQARGHLHRLDLSDEEIRERLYRAHAEAASTASRATRAERRR